MANRAKAPRDASLSTIQQSTLEWMAWRESANSGGGQREEGTGAAGSLESALNGGMLGHLSSEEASACVVALIQQEAANTPAGKSNRWAFTQRGTVYIIARTTDSLHYPCIALWMYLSQNVWRYQ